MVQEIFILLDLNSNILEECLSLMQQITSTTVTYPFNTT